MFPVFPEVVSVFPEVPEIIPLVVVDDVVVDGGNCQRRIPGIHFPARKASLARFALLVSFVMTRDGSEVVATRPWAWVKDVVGDFVLLLKFFLLNLLHHVLHLNYTTTRLLLHLSLFLTLRPLYISTVTVIITTVTRLISVPASPHMTLSWQGFRQQLSFLLLQPMNHRFFLQSCMKLLLFLCLLFHMFHAKFNHYWSKSSLQSCAMLVSSPFELKKIPTNVSDTVHDNVKRALMLAYS